MMTYQVVLDWAVFDWAVNSGTGRVAKAVQKICDYAQDGATGPKTLALVNGQNTEYMIEELGKIRQEFYNLLKHLIHLVKVGQDVIKKQLKKP